MKESTARPPAGPRFEFGENWKRFATELPTARIDAARDSLAEMLERDSLNGLEFLDAGSGSGLFSLAASMMGAERVHSFDFDPASVETTRRLKAEFAEDAPWTIDRGDVLDDVYMRALGAWDVVYSWGVLHHTGDLWSGLANTCERVRPGGHLFVAVYNDQGSKSVAWRWIKRIYNALPGPLKLPYAVVVAAPVELRRIAAHTLRLRPREYCRSWRSDARCARGMSYWRDMVDWIGGYPFEVARPEEVFDFCSERGFVLRRLRTTRGSHGCNEYVFERAESGDDEPAPG